MSPDYILAIRKAKNIHFKKKNFGGFAHPFANVMHPSEQKTPIPYNRD